MTMNPPDTTSILNPSPQHQPQTKSLHLSQHHPQTQPQSQSQSQPDSQLQSLSQSQSLSQPQSLSPNPQLHAHRCPTCLKTFKRNWHLMRHEQSHSSEPRPFKCPLCSRVFARQDTLARHLGSHAKARILRAGSSGGDGRVSVATGAGPRAGPSYRLGIDGAREGRGVEGLVRIERKRKSTGGEEEGDGKAQGGTGEVGVASQLDAGVLFEHVQTTAADLHLSAARNLKALEDQSLNVQREEGGWTADHQLVMTDGRTPAATHADAGLSIPQSLPDDLYSSRVDLQARQWLRNLCATDSRVVSVPPND